MRNPTRAWRQVIVLTVFLALARPAAAQHFDVLVQSVNGKLTTGAADFDEGELSLGVQVFPSYFNSLYAVDEPGFNAIGQSGGTLPPGADALPGNAALGWDFLPMKVDGALSNLLYWDGAGTTPAEVAFGLPPEPAYSLSLFGENDARAAADGSAQLIPGQVIDVTAADGFIHAHRFFFLDNDHDDGNATVAAAGVYLVALRLRMATLNRSEPLYLLFGTPGVSLQTLAAADTWAQDHASQLAPSFSADFDGDLDVDGADFLTWQCHLGSAAALQSQGDADNDHVVGPLDLASWVGQFGLSVASFPGAASGAAAPAGHAVPEPPSHGLALLAIVVACLVRPLRPGPITSSKK